MTLSNIPLKSWLSSLSASSRTSILHLDTFATCGSDFYPFHVDIFYFETQTGVESTQLYQYCKIYDAFDHLSLHEIQDPARSGHHQMNLFVNPHNVILQIGTTCKLVANFCSKFKIRSARIQFNWSDKIKD